jgi:hypothetical protein
MSQHSWNLSTGPKDCIFEINQVEHRVSKDTALIAHAIMCLVDQIVSLQESVSDDLYSLRVAINNDDD